MRIVFFIHSLSSGGAERVTSLLANYWQSVGHDITIVTTASSCKDFYHINDAIRRVSLDLEIESDGAVFAIINNLRRVVRLRKIISQYKPDVAIAMMATSNIVLALACLGTKVTVIGSERIHPPMLRIGKVWEELRKSVYRFLDVLIVQTTQTKEWVQKNITVKQVEVIANPVSLPLKMTEPVISPDVILGDYKRKHIVLAVGRLAEQKGYDRLLSAFKLISNNHPDWLLVIIGVGGEESNLKQLTKCLGLSNSVHFAGVVGNVSDWYTKSDIYTMTSKFEGFPNTLLEAMAHGMPVIAMDCPTGPSDIIVNEVNGVLVPDGDVHQFANSLEQLMHSESDRLRFSKNAKNVNKFYAIDAVAKEWECFFESQS